MTSPISSLDTSTSIGSEPESSCVLKKMGAILPPSVTPPKRLFGTNGMSAGGPDHGVGGGLARRTGAHHVAHVGHEVALLLQVFDELHRAALAVFLGLKAASGRVFFSMAR